MISRLITVLFLIFLTSNLSASVIYNSGQLLVNNNCNTLTGWTTGENTAAAGDFNVTGGYFRSTGGSYTGQFLNSWIQQTVTLDTTNYAANYNGTQTNARWQVQWWLTGSTGMDHGLRVRVLFYNASMQYLGEDYVNQNWDSPWPMGTANGTIGYETYNLPNNTKYITFRMEQRRGTYSSMSVQFDNPSLYIDNLIPMSWVKIDTAGKDSGFGENWSASEIDSLYYLYDSGKKAENPDSIVIDGTNWYYTDEEFAGHAIGDHWIQNGQKYIYLGSGLTTFNPNPPAVPEPATIILLSSILFFVKKLKNKII